jgi:uncharacterized protein with PQ loop repeat
MVLLVVYVLLIVVGDVIAYFVGLLIESPQLIGISVEQPMTTASLTMFLLVYFLNLWVAWLIAVRITEPRLTPAH